MSSNKIVRKYVKKIRSRLYKRKEYRNNKSKFSCRKAKYRATPRGLYFAFKNNAKQRKHEFEVSMEYFMNLTKFDCFYCGDKTTSVDRVNNGMGYVYGNLVGTCKECNLFKHKYDILDFIKKCRKIVHKTIDLKI